MVKAIAIIGLRLLALNWVILGSSVVVFLPFSENIQSVQSIIYYSSLMAIGILLWIASPKMAQFIILPQTFESEKLEINAEEIVAAGSFLIGIYLFVTRFSSFIFGYIYHLEKHSSFSYLDKFVLPNVLVIIFSMFLVFGHKSVIVNLFKAIRGADSKVYKVED